MRLRLEGRAEFDYQVARSNGMWADHRARAAVTAALVSWLSPRTVCDPACGDGSILTLAHYLHPIETAWMADISQPNIDGLLMPFASVRACGDISEALEEFPDTDVLVLTEILEHLEDPDAVLARAARRGHRRLVASSPCMRPGQLDDNPEHLWQFDEDGYCSMLTGAGWIPEAHNTLFFPGLPYDFQMWVCRAA